MSTPARRPAGRAGTAEHQARPAPVLATNQDNPANRDGQEPDTTLDDLRHTARALRTGRKIARHTARAGIALHLIDTVGKLVNAAIAFLRMLAQLALRALKAVADGIVGWVAGAWGAIGNAVSGAWGALTGWLGHMGLGAAASQAVAAVVTCALGATGCLGAAGLADTFGRTDGADDTSDTLCVNRTMATNATAAAAETLSGDQASANQDQVARIFYAALSSRGLDRAQIAGILSNVHAESTLDPSIIQGHASHFDGTAKDTVDFIANTSGAGWEGVGLGLMQWTPGTRLLDKAEATGQTWHDPVFQIAWVLSDTSPTGALGGTRWLETYREQTKGKPAEQCARTFMDFLFGGASAWDNQWAADHLAHAGFWDARIKDWKADQDLADRVDRMIPSLGASAAAAVTPAALERHAACRAGAGAGTVTAGSTGGDAPMGQGNFSWMCKGAGVCRNGDAGTFYPHLEYGYQCVWYAWNRLAMLHGSSGWSWVMGNGGEIAGNLSGAPGWQVDKTPRAGDGISGYADGFSGGGYGHVAVVEEVRKEANGAYSVRISEGNYNTDGSGPWTGYNGRWISQHQLEAGNVKFFRHTGWKK